MLSLSTLGDDHDGKEDDLNVEDYDEHAADNSIKLSGKQAHLPHPVPLTMYNAITVSIIGKDGKEDMLNIEDDHEHAADNAIKLTGKAHLPHP